MKSVGYVREDFKDILRRNGYVLKLNFIYPDLGSLPEGYPWHRTERTGPVMDSDYTDTSFAPWHQHPVSVACILRGELQLTNADKEGAGSEEALEKAREFIVPHQERIRELYVEEIIKLTS